MKKVHLQNNKGFQWYADENIYVKGYAFDASGNFYDRKELLNYFRDINSHIDFQERVNYANGHFCVIIVKDEDAYVAVDPIRAFPLFYSRYRGEWIISDDPYYIAEVTGFSNLNRLAAREFLATGYVTGHETLVEGIRQVQAGELIHFQPNDLYPRNYFSYRTSKTAMEEYDEMKERGIEIFEKAFQQFATSLQGRTVVVPLSGGYDSRFIATMLKYFGYENVICVTYGRKSSPEIDISRKVAEKLGYPWIFVEYTDDLIKGFIDDVEFKVYFPFASNFTSMFFMQEYFAVKYLKDHQMIPVNSIFAPGHSGDFLGGSQLNKHGNLNMDEALEDIARRIYRTKYVFRRPENKNQRKKILERIEKSLQEKFVRDSDFAYSIHEDWDFKEKLAKFNFNSITTYTHFGYEFRLPFWDRELILFFRDLPLHVKIHKYLYDDILSNIYFKKYGLNFKRELKPFKGDIRKMKIKNRIKRNLPEAINRLFVTRKDPLFYNEITSYFINDLAASKENIRIYGNSYNSLIIQWYLYWVKQFLSHRENGKK